MALQTRSGGIPFLLIPFSKALPYLYSFQINKFTKTALHKLNLHTITTSPVLHINLAKQVQLKKPVKIELILQGETSHEGNIVILGGTEVLEDTAITSRYEFDGRSVTFHVDHFSM